MSEGVGRQLGFLRARQQESWVGGWGLRVELGCRLLTISLYKRTWYGNQRIMNFGRPIDVAYLASTYDAKTGFMTPSHTQTTNDLESYVDGHAHELDNFKMVIFIYNCNWGMFEKITINAS